MRSDGATVLQVLGSSRMIHDGGQCKVGTCVTQGFGPQRYTNGKMDLRTLSVQSDKSGGLVLRSWSGTEVQFSDVPLEGF